MIREPKITTDEPVVVEETDLVRVEKSLHALGFFASRTNREISRTIAQVFRRPNGQRVQAEAIIEGIPSLGLPTTADRDKYMAFMKLALEQRDYQSELTNPISFTGAEIIRLLRLRKGGFHYDEINEWCRRMVATTITSESSIFLADRKQYASDIFHVFERVVLVGEELHDGTRSEHYQVYLSHWQLTNLNQGYLLPLDFNAYLSLKRDIAKALFGQLSIWFYASRGQSIEKKYADLCQLLHIRAYEHLSKARAVLAPSLDELVTIGYLSDWELTKTSSGSDFKLSLSPGSRLLGLPNFSQLGGREFRAELEAKRPAWITDLVANGVVERKARQLALDIPEDQPVADQIEYAKYQIERGSRSIENPAGFLIWAIESNLPVPSTFDTARKRTLREARDQVDSEECFRVFHLRNQYETFCESETSAYLDALAAEALEASLKEQIKVLKREQPEWFGRVTQAVRQELAMGLLRAASKRDLGLPTFEQWSKRDSQQRLF